MKNDIKALLIEHDPSIEDYQYTIEKAGIQVITIDEYNEEKIRTTVRDEYLDFVITDVFFLPKGQRHSELTDDDKYRLPEIIKAVRSEDSRVKIIVYTRYNRKIDMRDLNEVDYVFDKRYLTADLFKWQMERLVKNDLIFEDYEHTLSKSIFILLQSDPNLIWRDNLTTMLKRYRNGINEQHQVQLIKDEFLKIFISLDFPENINECFEIMVKNEPLNLVSNQKKWGHLRHAINVFWFGYYILNSGAIDISTYCKELFPEIKEFDEARHFLNQSWLIASLFHDIGYFGELVPEYIKNGNEALSRYPSKQNVNNSISVNHLDFTIERFDMFRNKIILGGTEDAGQELHDIIKSRFNAETIDHGILSAVTLYELLYTKENETHHKVLNPSLTAISWHNILEKDNEILKNYTFLEQPLTSLLVLCDHIEVWDRNTGFEKHGDPLPLESVELYKIEVIDKVLHIVINYQMFRADIPYQEYDIEGKLIKLLDRKFKPTLNSIKGIFTPKISIKFKLNHRKVIYSWPNSFSQ